MEPWPTSYRQEETRELLGVMEVGTKGNGHPGQGTANFLVGGLEFRETFTGRGYLSLILKDE